ncbi:thioesterase family protein [Yonghaparkia sp. Soil809]|uniref:acyl-CoA thioesterase n=1 Tax=Yonghaparkia sp. Soil809 TaxID=1736417 RepID=UPI000701760A|nr:acyl-CoA thioesterase [Yonghaparkia sp. Soil809]KRF33877.1 4-hydroxybenzoyl-CoA thioesterase [Yonghaparkia sp. Soil809]
MIVRLLLLSIRSRFGPRLAPTDVARTAFRVLPTDLDVLNHMNNGVYLSIMDLGRIDLMARSGVWPELRRRGYYPVVVSSTITYRRSLEPWQRFTVESRIVGLDDVAGYVEQRFVRDGEVCARGVIKARFLKRSGGIVPIPELAELFGLDPDDHALPEWLAHWSAAASLPPRREPTPSVWD